MFLNRFLCLFGKHVPQRSKVHWDGLNYVGECRHCGITIRRRSHGNWKRDWLEPESTPEDPVRPPPHSSS